jgi:hypothetical protein
VRLIALQSANLYVKSGKNDANDVYEAASRPTMRFVLIKPPNSRSVRRCTD